MKLKFADRSITVKLIIIQTIVIFLLMSMFIVYISARLTVITRNNQVNELKKYDRMVIGMIEAFNYSVSTNTANFGIIFKTYFPGKFEINYDQPVDVEGVSTPTLKYQGVTLNLRFDELDEFSRITTCMATLFVRKDQEFIRIATTLKKENGQRAIGTVLSHDHPAYAQLLAGQTYLGKAQLFGINYMTQYTPIKANNEIIGATFIGINFEESLTILRNKIRHIQVGESGYVFVVDAQEKNKGQAIIHPTKEGQTLLNIKDVNGRPIIAEIIQKKNGIISYPWMNTELGETKPRDKMVSFTYFPDWEWIICSGSYVEEFSRENKNLNFLMIVFGCTLILAIVFLLGFIGYHWVSRPLSRMALMAKDLASGEADLTKRLPVISRDEIGLLSTWINQFIQNIQELVIEVQEASNDVVQATHEISKGSEDMASRSIAQAASINQTAVTLENMTASVKLNSANANEVNKSLTAFNTNIQARKKLITDVTQTMKEIDDSSNKIDGIINVINDISFQTNLLALNAAVEAARAGEAGRGFAVVAAEVRNLAQKTAESSKTIREIVTNNVGSTHRGILLVEETAHFFQEIIQIMQTIVQRIQQITFASDEQSNGVVQISEAIIELERTLNQNTSIVEAFAETSKNMKNNASHLQEVVDNFKVTI